VWLPAQSRQPEREAARRVPTEPKRAPASQQRLPTTRWLAMGGMLRQVFVVQSLETVLARVPVPVHPSFAETIPGWISAVAPFVRRCKSKLQRFEHLNSQTRHQHRVSLPLHPAKSRQSTRPEPYNNNIHHFRMSSVVLAPTRIGLAFAKSASSLGAAARSFPTHR
jgi:hypothetical protein